MEFFVESMSERGIGIDAPVKSAPVRFTKPTPAPFSKATPVKYASLWLAPISQGTAGHRMAASSTGKEDLVRPSPDGLLMKGKGYVANY